MLSELSEWKSYIQILTRSRNSRQKCTLLKIWIENICKQKIDTTLTAHQVLPFCALRVLSETDSTVLFFQYVSASRSGTEETERTSRCCPILFHRPAPYFNLSFYSGAYFYCIFSKLEKINLKKRTDLTTTILWVYSFGQGMVVGIFGIATGSMGISYSKIKDPVLFKNALKKVMIMAWVTISFSFCIFFWIVVAMAMFIDNYWQHCTDYYCNGYHYHVIYPYVFVGELLCFMIQWGFLFYFINMLGSPCQCCAVDSCCYTESFVGSAQAVPQVLQQAYVPGQNQVPPVQQVIQPAHYPAPVIIYQQPYGQQQLPQVVYQGQQNPAANFEEKKETNEPVTDQTGDKF